MSVQSREDRLREQISGRMRQTIEVPTLNLMQAVASGAPRGELVGLTSDWVRAVIDGFAYGISVTIQESEKLEGAEHRTMEVFLAELKDTYLGPIKEMVNQLVGKLPGLGLIGYGPGPTEAQHLVQEPSGFHQPVPVTVLLSTLGLEPAELLRDISVVVQPKGDGYVATYFDAGISMSGDTQEEAVQNLKSVMVHLLEEFEGEPPETLGPGLSHQLAVLKRVMRRKGS